MKRIVLFTILLGLSLPLWSQLELGIKFGPSFSKWQMDVVDQDITAGTNFVNLPGIVPAIFLRSDIVKNFGVQTELSYVRKGIRFYQESFSEETTSSISTPYLQAALLLQYRFVKRKRFAGFAELGIFQGFGFNVRYSIDGEDIKFSFGERRRERLLPQVSDRHDYGLVGGLGCDYLLKTSTIFFNLRYQRSLNTYFLIDQSGIEEFRAKHQLLECSFGIRFRLN